MEKALLIIVFTKEVEYDCDSADVPEQVCSSQ